MKRITLNGTKVNFNAVASDKRADSFICIYMHAYITAGKSGRGCGFLACTHTERPKWTERKVYLLANKSSMLCTGDLKPWEVRRRAQFKVAVWKRCQYAIRVQWPNLGHSNNENKLPVSVGGLNMNSRT